MSPTVGEEPFSKEMPASLKEAEQQNIMAHVAGRYKAEKVGNFWK